MLAFSESDVYNAVSKTIPRIVFSKGDPLSVTKAKKSGKTTLFCFGDSKGIRTPVAAVRGLSLNRLTMEP